MDPDMIGQPTYHSRVERWECDYNDHWNARFYGRSFQMAAEVIAARAQGSNPGAAAIAARHMRFHRELRVSAPVEVRSAVLREAGDMSGATVHLLLSNGSLAATALDFPGSIADLPAISAAEIPQALPWSVAPGAITQPPAGAQVTEVELGPVRDNDLDHTRQLRFEVLVRHGSTIQHAQLNRLGFTQEYSDRCRINRMGVEFHITRGHTPSVGTTLQGQMWFTGIKGKSIQTGSRIVTAGGETVATLAICIVTVDLDIRRAVAVPDFLYRAFETQDAK